MAKSQYYYEESDDSARLTIMVVPIPNSEGGTLDDFAEIAVYTEESADRKDAASGDGQVPPGILHLASEVLRTVAQGLDNLTEFRPANLTVLPSNPDCGFLSILSDVDRAGNETQFGLDLKVVVASSDRTDRNRKDGIVNNGDSLSVGDDNDDGRVSAAPKQVTKLATIGFSIRGVRSRKQGLTRPLLANRAFDNQFDWSPLEDPDVYLSVAAGAIELVSELLNNVDRSYDAATSTSADELDVGGEEPQWYEDEGEFY